MPEEGGNVPDIHLPELPHDAFALTAWVILGVVGIATAVVFCLVKLAQARQTAVDSNLAKVAEGVDDLKSRHDRLSGAHDRTSAKVENIEKHVEGIRRDVDELRKPRRWF